MKLYKIDNIIDVPANGDCMFESIWKSLDVQLREDIIKEVYHIIDEKTEKGEDLSNIQTYIVDDKQYRYLRILCHFYETLPEKYLNLNINVNINTLRDNNAPDADKNIFDLNGKERWGDSAEIIIIQSFLEKQGHNIHIQVYEKQEGDCYRVHDFHKNVDKNVDEKVDKEIFLIYVGKYHYKYTTTKPREVSVVDEECHVGEGVVKGDVVEEGDVKGAVVGEEGVVKGAIVEEGAVKGAIVGEEGVGGVKTNVAPMIVLSIFVLFMAAVSE